MPVVDTLLTLLVEDSRNVAARMAAAGYSEDEVRGAWTYAARRDTPNQPAWALIGWPMPDELAPAG